MSYSSDTARSSPRRPSSKKSGAGNAALFIVLFLIGVIFCVSALFNVTTVEVSGASYYTAEEIITASGVTPESNIIMLNTDKCAEDILKQLVYIEEVKISRSFPHKLKINVTASVPQANFVTDNSTLLISKGGKILDRLDEPRAGLISFFGTEPDIALIPGENFASLNEVKTNSVYKLLDTLETRDSEKITNLDLTDSGNIRMLYDDRITVELGSINDIDYKLNFSEMIIEKKIGDKTSGVLTILSDSSGASFLDSGVIERNEQVFRDNMAAIEAAELAEQGIEPEEEDTEDNNTGTTAMEPIME
ncbi:MAG: cell division protein FtsQ/DivIB [Huintestinicola sp.]